jgi:glycosyltransferase involved in cell wall biosynthesis
MSCPVSVCVLVCDEAAELERCLASVVSWADEIVVVVDAKSTDGSETIARRVAQRVEVRAYAGDVDQKRHCAGLAKNDWIFIIDPDEIVMPELAESIRGALQAAKDLATVADAVPQGPDGYRVNRATYHLGRWIRHGDFYPDWKLRLFRRSRARWEGRDPHGRVEIDGAVADLSGELAHYSYRDLADQISRIQFFSDQAAAALVAEGVPVRLGHLILRPPARFLRSYVLKQGFRDGLPGFVIAVASAFYVFLKYAKHWERARGRANDEPGHL